MVWAVRYTLVVDERWHVRRAVVAGLSATGTDVVVIDVNEDGRWRVDGRAEPDLDGCFDVDLEASACTNTLPIHRLALGVDEEAAAPAVYVRATDLAVMRLEQTYRRLESPDDRPRYHYRSSTFDFECVLVARRAVTCRWTHPRGWRQSGSTTLDPERQRSPTVGPRPHGSDRPPTVGLLA